MFKDISVWQCCRKQGQNYLNVGRGGGEYICTQGGKIGSFSTLVHLFRLRLYLKHWGINLPVCIQRENAEKHSNVISVTERTEEFTELVLDTVCPSVCLSVAESHGERCVCVYAFLHYWEKEASCSPTLAALGHKAAWAMCLTLPWQQRTARLIHTCACTQIRVRTHTRTLLSPTHIHAAVQQQNDATGIQKNWGEALHNTGRIQKMPGERGERREERTAGAGGGRERERQGNETPPSPAVADIHRKKPKHLLAHQDYTVSEWESSQSPGPCYMRYPCLFAIWLCEQHWNGLKSWISDMLLIFCCQTVTKDHNSFPAHIFKCQHPIQNKTPQVSTHHFSVPK